MLLALATYLLLLVVLTIVASIIIIVVLICIIVAISIGNGKEYVRNNNGFWCQNGDYHTLTDNIIEELNRFLDGYEYDDLCLHEISTSSHYNEPQEKERILDIFQTFK